MLTFKEMSTRRPFLSVRLRLLGLQKIQDILNIMQGFSDVHVAESPNLHPVFIRLSRLI